MPKETFYDQFRNQGEDNFFLKVFLCPETTLKQGKLRFIRTYGLAWKHLWRPNTAISSERSRDAYPCFEENIHLFQRNSRKLKINPWPLGLSFFQELFLTPSMTSIYLCSPLIPTGKSEWDWIQAGKTTFLLPASANVLHILVRIEEWGYRVISAAFVCYFCV